MVAIRTPLQILGVIWCLETINDRLGPLGLEVEGQHDLRIRSLEQGRLLLPSKARKALTVFSDFKELPHSWDGHSQGFWSMREKWGGRERIQSD